MKVFMSLMSLFLSITAFAGIEDDVTGKFFDLNEKERLYDFKREVVKDGERLTVTRTYTSLDGKLAAKETVHYQGGKFVKMELDHMQLKHKGVYWVDREKKKVFFEYTKEDGKTKKEDEDLKDNFVPSDFIVEYLRRNWAKLEKGDSVKIRFPVFDRKETVGFKFFKEKDDKVDGKDVMVIKMKPSSFIIAALVDPLYFYIHKKDGKQLLKLVGRTVPKIKNGNDWKDLDVIAYYQKK